MYPTQYATPWRLKSGLAVSIRPIQPEDEPLLVKFHQALSAASVYHRYFGALKLSQRVTHERLTRICFNDYTQEIALVAELVPPEPGKNELEEIRAPREIIGVGRLSKLHGTNDAEFALLITDKWHGLGLGSELLKQLVQIGRAEKLTRITALIHTDNRAMQHLSRKIGFQITPEPDGHDLIAELKL